MKTALIVLILLAGAAENVCAAEHLSSYPRVDNVLVRVGDDPQWSSPALDETGWEEMPWYHINPQKRLLWVRAHVQVPADFDTSAEPFGVLISGTASYEVFWNGKRIGQNGLPAATQQLEQPGRIDAAFFVPSHLVRTGNNLLALRMSSFHLSRELAAPMQWMRISRYGEPPMMHIYTLTLCAIGALLLGTVYFAAVFLSNRSDLSALLLACLSLSVLLQSLAETIRLFVSYPYPLHILRLELILSLAAVSSLLLVAYVSHQYARKWRGLFVTITLVGVVACAWFIPGFDSKTTMLVLTAVLVSLAAAIVGMTKKHQGAAGAAIALAGVIAVAIVDVQNFINQTYYVATVALLLVLFAQQVRALRRAQREQAQAELRSTRLELELLKKQIQPHFLMNTLTTLTELLESEPASAVAMVESLAEELRAISAVSGEATIPLQQELDLCRHHLKVMSFRKAAQFDLTTTDVDLATRVPPGIFHTLMENALTHNRYSTRTVFELEESTSSNGRKLFRLRTPMSERPAAKSTSGTGHGYVRARLTEAFGKEWSFRSAADGDYWLDEIEIGAVA